MGRDPREDNLRERIMQLLVVSNGRKLLVSQMSCILDVNASELTLELEQNPFVQYNRDEKTARLVQPSVTEAYGETEDEEQRVGVVSAHLSQPHQQSDVERNVIKRNLRYEKQMGKGDAEQEVTALLSTDKNMRSRASLWAARGGRNTTRRGRPGPGVRTPLATRGQSTRWYRTFTRHSQRRATSSDVCTMLTMDGMVGRVGYICVAEEFNLSEMEVYYRGQGYSTKFDFGVLHVRLPGSTGPPAAFRPPTSSGRGDAAETLMKSASRVSLAQSHDAELINVVIRGSDSLASEGLQREGERQEDETETQRNRLLPSSSSTLQHGFTALTTPAPFTGACFDLFLFDYGAAVWWSMDHRYFRIVERDFLLPDSVIDKFIINRYPTRLISENYPVWCTYVLVQKETLDADEDFKKHLRFDQFLIPCTRDATQTGVSMLCASHALAQSAKIDYLEIKVEELTDNCSPLPRELREAGHVTITERRLLQLRGELLSYRLMLKSGSDLLDEPEFFWENSFLKPIFEATKESFDVSERVEALDMKLDAANEIVSMLAEEFSQRHGARLEWIVIWLVFVEVVIGVLELLSDMRPFFLKRSS